MLRTQDFIAPVGGGLTVQIKANYIKYLSGSAGGLSARVRVRGDLGGVDVLMVPGDSVRLPETVSQFTVQNYDGQASIAGVFIAGLGEFSSDRVIGEVEVIDTAAKKTGQGRSFMGVRELAVAAGKFARFMLWNVSPGSGRLVELKRFGVTPSVGGEFMFRLMNSTYADAGITKGVNKLGGGSSSLTEIRAIEAAAMPGGIVMARGAMEANKLNWIEFGDPIVYGPGYGLDLYCPDSANVKAVFEFSEILL